MRLNVRIIAHCEQVCWEIIWHQSNIPLMAIFLNLSSLADFNLTTYKYCNSCGARQSGSTSMSCYFLSQTGMQKGLYDSMAGCGPCENKEVMKAMLGRRFLNTILLRTLDMYTHIFIFLRSKYHCKQPTRVRSWWHASLCARRPEDFVRDLHQPTASPANDPCPLYSPEPKYRRFEHHPYPTWKPKPYGIRALLVW